MDKNEISKEFITKLNNKDCAFYRGSNKIEVEKVLIQTINYEKGEYFQCQNNYNYKVMVKANLQSLILQEWDKYQGWSITVHIFKLKMVKLSL